MVSFSTMFLVKMLFVLFIVHLYLVSYSESVDNNSTFSAAINGEELVKLGRKLHKPILTLIGMTLHNLHPCDDWTPWSSCSEPRIGNFGSRSRSRKCDYTQNAGGIKNTTETDNKLCEGFCPVGYNVTEHGYCIRLNLLKLSNDDAQKQCQLDGGNLINVDSQQKFDDVKRFTTGYTDYIIVDGKRKDVSSPWTYKYGSQTGVIIWNSGQPGNAAKELCLCLNGSNRLWHDTTCNSKFASVCEITSV